MRFRSRASALPVGSSTGSLFLTASCALFAVLLLRTAWVCDDAYITFRTVDNFVNGYGPRWNVAERVQTYTHPLWMLLVSAFYLVTREPYFTSLALSIALSVASVWLLLRRASSLTMMLLCATCVVSSKAFVDFSTSGLENPLSHLWLVLAAPLVFLERPERRDVLRLALVTSLAIVTRLDNGLLLLPCLAGVTLRAGWRPSLRPLVVGAAPLIVWQLFALVYYGALLPNTVYAKLDTGIPASELLAQGFVYLSDSLANDPVTLPLILIAFGIAAVRRRAGDWVFAIGLVLHLTYIVRVGGDFMSGRFLTAPFFWSLLFVSRLPFPAPAWAMPLPLLVVIGVGQLGSSYPLWSDGTFGPDGAGPRIPESGVTDERRYYYPTTGLLRWHMLATPPVTGEPARVRKLLAEGRTSAPRDAVGFFGYHAGRQIHVIDVLGLGDPLLARLPSERPWRIGHFYRKIPAGYEASVLATNQIEDAGVAAFYDDVRLVTRGPLFAGARWAAIGRLMFGRDEASLTPYRQGLRSILASAVPSAASATPDQAATIDIGRGLHIRLAQPIEARLIEIGLDLHVDYRITALRGGVSVHSELTRAADTNADAVAPRTLTMPQGSGAIDAVEIVPRRGEPPFRLGWLRVEAVGAR